MRTVGEYSMDSKVDWKLDIEYSSRGGGKGGGQEKVA